MKAKVFLSEPDVEEILSNAMVRISCAGDGKCNQESLLKALTLRINEAISARLVGPFTLGDEHVLEGVKP